MSVQTMTDLAQTGWIALLAGIAMWQRYRMEQLRRRVRFLELASLDEVEQAILNDLYGNRP